MDDQQKRAAIYAVYNTDSWHQKVTEMSDRQVLAIYMKFKAEGKVK